MRCGAFHRVEGTLCLVRHGQAALSGSKTKAPGFAGGYLLNSPRRLDMSGGFPAQRGHCCVRVRALRRVSLDKLPPALRKCMLVPTSLWIHRVNSSPAFPPGKNDRDQTMRKTG